MNGTAAVIFFFTLSGFVLSWSYFQSQNKITLVQAFFKRWPRLAGPVVLSTLLSFLLFKYKLYFFEQAAIIVPGPWLPNLGCPPPYCESGWTYQFQPNFLEALVQGLTTFFTGHNTYNSNLWTMQIEFVGSIAVFIIAAFIAMILSFDFILVSLIIFAIWSLSFFPYLFPFIFGIHLAALFTKYKPKINLLIATLLLLVGLYLLSYLISEKDFSWVSYVYLPDLIGKNSTIIINTIGGSLIIFAIMANHSIFNSMNGALSTFIGKLSFPLYLVHTLIICSLSSYAFIALHQTDHSSQLILIETFVITMIGSISVASLVIYFDDYWLKQINYLVKKVI